MDDTTTADQQAVHRWRLGVICNPGHFLDIEAPAHLPADNTSDTSMASAMMTAKPLTTSRAHAALRTQVSIKCMSYLERLRFDDTDLVLSLCTSLLPGEAAHQLCPLRLSAATLFVCYQVGSVRGCALLHRPIVRAVRCNRMIVRAAVSLHSSVLDCVRLSPENHFVQLCMPSGHCCCA